jgi:hypothetical protein
MMPSAMTRWSDMLAEEIGVAAMQGSMAMKGPTTEVIPADIQGVEAAAVFLLFLSPGVLDSERCRCAMVFSS